MKNDVIFTAVYNGEARDIAVDSSILIADLIEILMENFVSRKEGGRIYSSNLQRILNSEYTLYEEKIWDGDILVIKE